MAAQIYLQESHGWATAGRAHKAPGCPQEPIQRAAPLRHWPRENQGPENTIPNRRLRPNTRRKPQQQLESRVGPQLFPHSRMPRDARQPCSCRLAGRAGAGQRGPTGGSTQAPHTPGCRVIHTIRPGSALEWGTNPPNRLPETSAQPCLTAHWRPALATGPCAPAWTTDLQCRTLMAA